MKDTDPDRPAARSRPAWVDEQAADVVQSGRPRRERLPRQPVPGRHEDDGLWEHATEIGGLVTLATWIAAVAIPHDVPLWQLAFMGAAVTVVTGWVSLSLTDSAGVAGYLTAWGAGLTAWFTAARLASPWRGMLIACLLLMAAVLILTGVPVIRKHRDRVRRVAEVGRDNMNTRECRHWQDLLPQLEVPNVTVRDVIRVDGGYQVHCRHDKAADGRRVSAAPDAELARRICIHKRLPKGAVYIQDEPDGATGGAADFIIHVRTVTGPRLTRYLPAENTLLSVNRKFALGVHDTGREFMLRLREVVVFIVGVIGSGKSTLLNVFLAQLARMPDVLIFMIDLKGGQEARAWLMPWLRGLTDRPVIDWLATTREEADIMMDALKRAGTARAEHPRYGKKLRPSPDAPAIIVICDETTVMTGHFIRTEDGLSNTKLAVKLLQIAETFRSVAISPVVSSVRAVVDNTGNSGLKAMSSVRIGMRVESAEEGRQIFPDHIAAARQLAQLKDRGMGIPKVGAELSPPVHFYNITDGTLDDDGHPTEDRITPIAIACGTRERRPKPEQLVIDAMGEDYAKRWQQPHIAQLTAAWMSGAGETPVPPAPLPAGPPLADDDPFDDIVSAFRSELDSLDSGDSSGLDPRRKRMRQLLIGRGRQGWARGLLWNQLLTEGFEVAQETVSRWLAADEKAGYVIRTGKPRSRWVWRLPEGAEFDIPGMDG